MGLRQLSFLPLLPPASTIQVQLDTGEFVTGTIGPLSSSETGKRGWTPDPDGTHYPVHWYAPVTDEWRQWREARNLPIQGYPSGLYFQKEYIFHLLEHGLPYDGQYQNQLTWERRKKHRRPEPEDEEEDWGGGDRWAHGN